MKLIKYIAYMAILLAACEAEQNNPLVIATCYDGIQNQNEEKIDCGGKCAKCQVVVVPCKSSLADNRITYRNVNTTFTSKDVYFYQSYDAFSISLTKGNVTYDIALYVKALPTTDTIFPIVNSYAADQGKATMMVTPQSYYYGYDVSSGYIYVTYVNKQWAIEFCSVPLSGTSYTVSGRILYSR
ncbi:MAG: hypothetical protein C0523_03285 [Cytophaga sp.]|nr:hypothetical protein [Cytophaga sp.]